MKKATLLLFAILMLVPLGFSEEPTYEQTQKWIVSKIQEAGYTRVYTKDGDYYNVTYTEASMDDCKLKYTSVMFFSGLQFNKTSPSVTNITASIPLGKVSSVKVPHDSFGYHVNISTPEKVITTTSVEKRGDTILSQTSDSVDSDGITFGKSRDTDEDTANRMQKALTHAVSLCTNTQEKEPF